MPNLLAIPFKKTYSINLKDPVRNYISTHGGAHPDEFKTDIKIWQDLRKDGTGGVVHINRIDTALLYVSTPSLFNRLVQRIKLSRAASIYPRKAPYRCMDVSNHTTVMS